jgi:YidC/Oxa1 family membrane protein insertase
MFDVIARVLAFFYSLPVVGGSYGLAIMLLTAAVMILLMPLTIRATRSTIKMQEVQPKLKELQKKYKDDKPTLNAELMELYKTNGINPVGGCLPMVAQLPVFLVLFRVLRGLSRRVSETPFFAIADHARVAVGAQPVQSHTFDPSYLATDSAMYKDLHGATKMPFGPFDLAQEPIDVLQANLVRGIPYLLLILFVVGTSFYQQRQVSSRRTGATTGMNPQQEMILKFLPLMSGIWSFAFPAGLVLYWATSNAFRIVQQTYITRAFYGDKASSTEALSAEPESTKGSGPSSEESESTTKTSGSGASAGNGRSPRTRSGPQPPAKSGEGARNGSNGDSADSDAGRGKIEDLDREQAWAKRRRERARVQAANRSRSEQSSRVTPKGTKPSDSKRKRKR